MFRVFSIFLFSTLPSILCAQHEDKKKPPTVKEPTKFKVVDLKEPLPHLGKYADNNEVSKTELLKCDSLQIKHCFNLPSQYTVTRFRFSALVEGEYHSYMVKGCRLTPQIKDVLERTTTGTKIKFSGIIAQKKVKKDTVSSDFDDLVLKVFDDTDTNLITYKLKNQIPEPGLYSIKHQLPSKVTHLDLMFVDELYVKCDCKIPSLRTEFRVVAFDLMAYCNGYKMVYSAKGSSLTPEMREELAHAKTGMKFRIQNIRVKTVDGLSGYLRPRTFKVIP